jgi:hypothetical protein
MGDSLPTLHRRAARAENASRLGEKRSTGIPRGPPIAADSHFEVVDAIRLGKPTETG